MLTMGGRFAEEMRRAREAKGITKYRLAKISGISDGLLSRLESGKQLPADETVARLADALGASYEALLASAWADRLGDQAVDRLAAIKDAAASSKHNNDARLRTIHEIKTLNNSLGSMSGDTSMTSVTSQPARGTHGTVGQLPADFVELPLYGPVACGSPLSWSLEDAQETYPVLRSDLEETNAVAVFRVSGDSMAAERIRDRDVVMVRPYNGDDPRHGDIVIVESEGGYVCKMYRKSLLGSYLESRYLDKEPEMWKPAGEVKIVGLVVGFSSRNLYGGRR